MKVVIINLILPEQFEPSLSGVAVILNDGVSLEKVKAVAREASKKARSKTDPTPTAILEAVKTALNEVGQVSIYGIVEVETEQFA